VLVGAGQITDRPEDPLHGLEPLALMEQAARRALDDAGAGRIALGAIDTVAVVTNVFHDYADTARMLAERLGVTPRRTLLTTWGGNTPLSLLSHLCDEIAAGRSDAALMAGAEAVRTMRALGKAGLGDPWTPAAPTAAPRWGDTRAGGNALEARHGMREVTVTFALVESAFRAARGQSLAAQRAEIGAYGERCARVAASNPYAWFHDAKDAATLVTVRPDNRMIAFPYPKYVNAIMDVNQGAALLLTNEATADRLAIAADHRIHPWAGVDVTEHWFLSERAALHELPGMRRAARTLLECVDLTLDRIAHLDLYSCFPIAPRLSAAMLGLDPATPRTLSVAGGLPWFGGPGNNYTTHAIAAMMQRLRADRDAFGLVHALGWNLTKHALAVYSATPPPSGWRRAGGEALQRWVDEQPHADLAADPDGAGTLEAHTVLHGRDGEPERGAAMGRLGDGRRFLAVLPADRTVLAALELHEGGAISGTVRTRDGLSTFEPR